MQGSKECDVAKEIHNSFVNTYNNMFWSWYAVWRFDPSAKWNSIATKFSYHKVVQGMAENGGWKVYWTAQKKPDDWDQQGWLKVDSKWVRLAIDPDGKDCKAANFM